MRPETRSTPAALTACALAAAQAAEACRAVWAAATTEACARAETACRAAAIACDGCGDLYECRRAATYCRDASAICALGPSDRAAPTAYWCAQVLDEAAAACRQATAVPETRAAGGDRETRILSAQAAECRLEEQDGRPYLTGLAAVYNSLSEDLGGFRERIQPGAFRQVIVDAEDVVLVPDHEYRAADLLGRTTSGTLSLVDTDAGLRFRAQIPDTTTGRDIAAVVKRGDLRGMSFGFKPRPNGEAWSKQADGTVIRDLTNLFLVDVSPVVFPAYRATSVIVSRRALDQVQDFRRPPARLRHLLKHLAIERARQ